MGATGFSRVPLCWGMRQSSEPGPRSLARADPGPERCSETPGHGQSSQKGCFEGCHSSCRHGLRTGWWMLPPAECGGGPLRLPAAQQPRPCAPESSPAKYIRRNCEGLKHGRVSWINRRSGQGRRSKLAGRRRYLNPVHDSSPRHRYLSPCQPHRLYPVVSTAPSVLHHCSATPTDARTGPPAVYHCDAPLSPTSSTQIQSPELHISIHFTP